jgi:Capsule assembly protein Wzi
MRIWRAGGLSIGAAMLSAGLRVLAGAIFALLATVPPACASTYAVYIPLDSSIYRELDTLNGLGYLDSYLPEIKPIARVEAARLTLEAARKLKRRPRHRSRASWRRRRLARRLIRVLRRQLREEIAWLRSDREDGLPPMIHPVERAEAQYVYSTGTRRRLDTGSSGIDWKEGTPLLPYNDNLPTAAGSNEAARWSGWLGIGGFITGYGEGAIAGPLNGGPDGANRVQLLTGAAVVGLGNVAISFGQEETAWGAGHFGLLSQSNNGAPFPALRIQDIHPSHLPGFLRYLGLMRWQGFIGQLDGDRPYSHPWIDGQIVSFKTLPWLEWGLDHAIMFGGKGNDNYGFGGFLGRATGLDTGDPSNGNTNSRVGAYISIRVPQLRGTQLYYEILGEDFFQPFGSSSGFKTPFKAPSYQIGAYVPGLTADGLTDARAEWTVLDREYGVHNDSLYWTYQHALIGDALGPGAWRINAQVGRWFADSRKIDVGAFFAERNPTLLVPVSIGINQETSVGASLDYFELPAEVPRLADSLGELRAYTALEYVNDINYSTHSSLRAVIQLTVGLTPSWNSFVWR